MDDVKRFAIHQKYGVDINKKLSKPKCGRLIYTYCGKVQVLQTGNFSLLNYKKQIYIKNGFKKEYLKIEY